MHRTNDDQLGFLYGSGHSRQIHVPPGLRRKQHPLTFSRCRLKEAKKIHIKKKKGAIQHGATQTDADM